MLTWQYRDFRRYAAFESFMAIITTLQSLVVLFILSDRYISGGISIADFTIYFPLIVSLGGALSSVVDQVSILEKQTVDFTLFLLCFVSSLYRKGKRNTNVRIKKRRKTPKSFLPCSFCRVQCRYLGLCPQEHLAFAQRLFHQICRITAATWRFEALSYGPISHT